MYLYICLNDLLFIFGNNKYFFSFNNYGILLLKYYKIM